MIKVLSGINKSSLCLLLISKMKTNGYDVKRLEQWVSRGGWQWSSGVVSSGEVEELVVVGADTTTTTATTTIRSLLYY